MIENIKELNTIDKVYEKSICYNNANSNTSTGDKDYLYPKLKQSFKTVTSIDIIGSFLMESGIKILLQDLKEALNRGVKIRILTGNYLKITQPQALYLLKSNAPNDFKVFYDTFENLINNHSLIRKL